MYIADDWQEYEVIDTGEGMKYERWGQVYLLRPDPQVIWPYEEKPQRIDARYTRSDKGGGAWEYFRSVPESWHLHWRELTLWFGPWALSTRAFFRSRP